MGRLQNLQHFLKSPVTFLDSCFDVEKPIQRVSIGPQSMVVVFDPEIARDLLITRSDIYKQNRSIFKRITPITGEKGLVQLNGQASKKARKTAWPMFSGRSLKRAEKIIHRYSEVLFSSLNPGTEIDPTELTTGLVLQTAFKIFLDIELNQKTMKTANQFLELNQLCGQRMLSPLPIPLWVPAPSHQKIRQLRKDIRSNVMRQLASLKNTSPASIPSLFDGDPDMIDHCLTFLFAGHETTASSLSFTLSLLAQNPELQFFLQQGDDELTLASYKESLRLFPPAYMLVREAQENDQLGDIKVKKRDQIIIGLRQIHRHPKYFQSPNQYQPKRFLSGLSSPAFFPFGLGPKSCIGERLAYLEAKIVLQKFFSQFAIEKNNDQIEAKPLVTLHPRRGQKLKIIKRTAHVRRTAN